MSNKGLTFPQDRDAALKSVCHYLEEQSIFHWYTQVLYEVGKYVLFLRRKSIPSQKNGNLSKQNKTCVISSDSRQNTYCMLTN